MTKRIARIMVWSLDPDLHIVHSRSLRVFTRDESVTVHVSVPFYTPGYVLPYVGVHHVDTKHPTWEEAVAHAETIAGKTLRPADCSYRFESWGDEIGYHTAYRNTDGFRTEAFSMSRTPNITYDQDCATWEEAVQAGRGFLQEMRDRKKGQPAATRETER